MLFFCRFIVYICCAFINLSTFLENKFILFRNKTQKKKFTTKNLDNKCAFKNNKTQKQREERGIASKLITNGYYKILVIVFKKINKFLLYLRTKSLIFILCINTALKGKKLKINMI